MKVERGLLRKGTGSWGRSEKVEKGRVTFTKVHYMHARNCNNETHHIVPLICINNIIRKK